MSSGDADSVESLPFGEICLPVEGAGLSGCGVGLTQQNAGGGVDVPTQGGSVGIYIDDLRVDVADFLATVRGEGEFRIVSMSGDEGGVALDLVKTLLCDGGWDRLHLSLPRHERSRWREDGGHRTHGRVHGEMHTVRVEDSEMHLGSGFVF